MTHVEPDAGTGSRVSVQRADKKEKDFTIADLFLSGTVTGEKEPTKAADSSLTLIPDPTDCETESQPLLDREETSVKARQKAQNEMKSLQNYWKQFATFPAYWPRSKDARDRHEAFMKDYLSASKAVLAAGERIHCLTFVVVCAEKVGIRSTPTLNKDAQTGDVLCPGQCVVVEQIVSFEQVRFLKLNTGAWVFDRVGRLQVMEPMVNVEVGHWWYRVVSQDHLEVRTAPTHSSRARTGQALCPGEVCVVSLRCLVDGQRFYHLADGRGWIFEKRQSDNGTDSPPRSPRDAPDSRNEVVMSECVEEREEAEEEEVQTPRSAAETKRNAVETGLWQYQVMAQPILAVGSSLQGKLLYPAEKVHVNMRVPANGEKGKEWSVKARTTITNRIWLRLSDGRGWIPKSDVDGEPLVRFIGVAFTGQGATEIHSARGNNAGRESFEGWMHGVA
mmetsp:Transcript_147331/g.274510  ORF Transcript_147331/g.274510 Transcript_147331/m.274510 type:complete len:447 (+) Transcript_147331:81-1421(+)